ncbi:MutS-related protein, partial [Streptococcus suis]
LMLDYFFFHIIQSTDYKYKNELLECYDYISNLDNQYTLAMYSRTLDTYCEPIIVETEQKVDFENLIHPLLEDGVPNALNVNQNILLTGSNASGKSTFMKAVAINLILAQTLNIATADKFMYKPGLVYSSMVNVDDILSGDSYFMAELKSIRRLFNRSDDSPVYCFIDEIFKGT